jgi:NADPH:quinone reductase-like Zn-dependent oxidoreductase
VLALVNTPDGEARPSFAKVDEPAATPNEALVEARAFSLNRGELAPLGTARRVSPASTFQVWWRRRHPPGAAPARAPVASACR